MQTIRGRARWIAALALTVQVSVPAAAAMALCCAGSDAPTSTDMPCCKDGKAHVCPLTKKKADPAAPQLKSCCDPEEQVLVALFGAVGLTEAPLAEQIPLQRRHPLTVHCEQPIALAEPPHPPPPRA